MNKIILVGKYPHEFGEIEKEMDNLNYDWNGDWNFSAQKIEEGLAQINIVYYYHCRLHSWLLTDADTFINHLGQRRGFKTTSISIQ